MYGRSPGRKGRSKVVPWWEYHGVRAYRSGDDVYLVRYARWGAILDCCHVVLGAPTKSALIETVSMEVEEMLKKPEGRKVQGADVQIPRDIKAEKEIPTLWSYLTQTTWEDGTARQTAGLLIFAQDGMLKAMLRDKDAGLCLWVAGKSWAGLLGALEAALNDPEAEWRVDRQAEGDKAKRVRKGT